MALLLAACGGGGGSEPAVRPALPELVQDIEPAGPRIDLRASNYFPAGAGDTWTFDRVEGGVTVPGALTRSVQSVNGNDAEFSELENATFDTSTYRRTAAGIVEVDPLAGAAPAAARALIGDLLLFPEPFFAEGATRRSIRQGNWGADVDGDGIPESFRLELAQVLVGFETIALPRGSAQAAHLRTVLTLTLSPSRQSNRVATVTSTEDNWWAPGIGIVRAERSAVDQDGASVISPQTYLIASGSVGGAALFTAPPDGTVRKLALVHNDLVFDPLRQVYYASIPGSVVGNGNSIATIDATTGAVIYSAPVGSEPFALGLAPDASALHVGLNGSGEVVTLRLPDLQERGRTRLPVASFFGQLLAENIAVSPTDPSVVAVSTWRSGVSPRHAGVALIRNGSLQPRMTQEHTGSNLIAFDANGQFVYGYNNETTEFGLRRIAVLADGLAEQAVVPTDGNFAVRSLDATGSRLLFGGLVYGAPGLDLLGRVSAPSQGCRAKGGTNRLVCLQDSSPSNGAGRLVVVDATTFVTLATPAFAQSNLFGMPSQLVVGPAGQVALRFDAFYAGSAGSAIWLFSSPALP